MSSHPQCIILNLMASVRYKFMTTALGLLHVVSVLLMITSNEELGDLSMFSSKSKKKKSLRCSHCVFGGLK